MREFDGAIGFILAIRKDGNRRRETGRRLFLLRQFLILQRHPRREQLRAALSELLFHLRVRRSQHFACDGGGGHDRLHQMADVGEVLDRCVGVAVALEHHRLALILVEEDFVLERAAVPGSHDLHGLFRQALPFLDLAGMKFDPCNSFDLVHCCSLSKFPAQFYKEHLHSTGLSKVVYTFKNGKARP